MTRLQQLEHLALTQLMRMPARWIRRLGGAPTVIDGHRLDAHLQLGLKLEGLCGRGELSRASAADSRRELAASVARTAGPRVDVAVVVNSELGGRPVRVYRAWDIPETGGSALVFFHGGGGVAGDLDTHDEACRLLCRQLGTTVVSVDYRRAPEHAFPAAYDDALRVFAAVHEDAVRLDVDPARIGVAGDSFGGNLAAGVALAAGRGDVPACAAALLIYPWLDARMRSPSVGTFADGFLLTRRTMDWYRDQYLPADADRSDPRASPIESDALATMPPTVIVTAGFDPLRDEGHALSQALEASGVEVSYVCAESMIHGFMHLAGSLPSAGGYFRAATDALRPMLARSR